jgi:hypothetical protein
VKDTSYSDRRFCFSYILFIIVIGGILVLFIYITRIASNEIFSPSNKIHREVGRAKDLSAAVTITVLNGSTRILWCTYIKVSEGDADSIFRVQNGGSRFFPSTKLLTFTAVRIPDIIYQYSFSLQ